MDLTMFFINLIKKPIISWSLNMHLEIGY